MTEYYIPTAPSETEFVEKRSRFIGHVWPVESEEEARDHIEAMKKKYYDPPQLLVLSYQRGGRRALLR